MARLAVLIVAGLWLLSPPVAAHSERVARIASQCPSAPPLIDVLRATAAPEVRLAYSERTLDPRMKAMGNPHGSARQRLATWLALYGLSIHRLRAEHWLVAPDSEDAAVWAGRVRASDRRRLGEVELRIEGGAVQRVRSDRDGCFIVADDPWVSRDAVARIVHSDGFEPQRHLVGPRDWLELVLEAESSTSIETIVVMGSQHAMMGTGLAAETHLDREAIRRTPHVGDDFSRLFRRLPGVAAGDISPRAHVRGGALNEMAVLLDGLELHRPWYFKSLDGLVSMVDSNIIGSAEVLTGGMTAEYGGKTSGFIDIDTLAPSRASNTLGISYLTAMAQSGGTFNDEKGGWLASARAGYLDLAMSFTDAGEEVDPRYGDLFAQLAHDWGERHRWRVNLLTARDRLDFESKNPLLQEAFVDDASTSRNVWMNLESQWRGSLTSTQTLFATRTHHLVKANYDEPLIHWRDEREYRRRGARSQWQWRPSAAHMLKAGLEVQHVATDYRYRLQVQTHPQKDNEWHYLDHARRATLSPEGGQQAAYLAYRLQPFQKQLTAELGGRWSRETYTGLEEGVHFSPRLNLVYRFNSTTRANLYWGRYRQPQAVDGLHPGDGDNDFHPSQVADQRGVGLTKRWSDAWQIQVNTYQKHYKRLLPRHENLYENVGRLVDEASADRVRIQPETARAQGLELALNYRRRRFYAWANYSYSEVYDEFAGSVRAPRAWDQRHGANISLNWERGEWTFNLTGLFRTGWPITPPARQALPAPGGNRVPGDIEAYNRGRLEHYSRLDTRLLRVTELTGGAVFMFYLEVYNLLDTDNTCCLDYRADTVGDDRGKGAGSRYGLPRIPSLGLRFIF